MEFFLTALISGVSLGCLYGLVGLAFTSIFNSSRVINFATGELVMLGTFGASLFLVTWAMPAPIAVLLLLVMAVAGGLFVNLAFAERLVRLKMPIVTTVIITLGGALIISGSVGLVTDFMYFSIISPFGTKPLPLGPTAISPQYVAVIVTTIVVAIGYWFLLNKTRLGLGLRALGINSDMASLTGINPRQTRMLAWVIASAICGIAGFLALPIVLPSALMGLPLVVYGFIAAVLGGFGYPFAALAGGVILGLVIQFITAYISGGVAEFLMFILLLIVLMFRPAGILGLKTQY